MLNRVIFFIVDFISNRVGESESVNQFTEQCFQQYG